MYPRENGRKKGFQLFALAQTCLCDVRQIYIEWGADGLKSGKFFSRLFTAFYYLNIHNLIK